MRGFLFIFSYFSGCAKLLFMANLCSIYFIVSYIISQRGGGAFYLMFWSVLGPVTSPLLKCVLYKTKSISTDYTWNRQNKTNKKLFKQPEKRKREGTRSINIFLLGHAHRPNSDYIMLIGLCIGPIIEVICRAVF